MSKNTDKWEYMLDNIDCHPELREQVACKLQNHLENAEILVNVRKGGFDVKEFGKGLKAIVKPYDRRKNTLR